ncbi:MAG: hypothetical protein PWP54_1068 [Thermosipho sp. (in: thermotogales)]|nr:hypothetical protein [Thermosipho sp. (in: thermotogales)]
MKFPRYIWVVFIVFAFLFGCVGLEPIDLGPSEINDTGNDPDTPAYFVDIITDQDFIDLLNELFGGGTTQVSVNDVANITQNILDMNLATSLEGSDKIFGEKLLPEIELEQQQYTNQYDYLIHILDVIASKENLINKMKQFRAGVNNLLQYEGRYDYLVEITGNAKTKVENVLNQLKDLDSDFTVDNLYGDFRDVMILNLLIEPFIFIHDNHEALVSMVENASETAANGPEPIIRQEFLSEINTFETLYPTIEASYFSSPTFLSDFKTFLDNLSDISPDENYLDLNDIFVDDAFVFPWVDKAIHLSDLLVKTIVEINAFETQKTDNNGFRNDGKITIWTYGEDASSNVAITLQWYDEPVVDQLPDGVTASLNGEPINTSMQVIDVLEILNTALPDNSLNLTIDYATPIDTDFEIDVNFSLTFDFQKLSSQPVDLKDCNLKMNDQILDMLNVASMTEFASAIQNVSTETYTQEGIDTFVEYITFITDNLEFVSFNHDPNTLTTTIVFEYNLQNGAVVATLTLTFEGFTIPQLMNPLSFSQDVINSMKYLNNSFLSKIRIN